MRLDFHSDICMGIIQFVSKTSHSFKFTRTIELRINSFFKNTRHLTQTEEKKPPLEVLLLKQCKRGFIGHFKAGEEPLYRAVYVPFYSNKVTYREKKQVT